LTSNFTQKKLAVPIIYRKPLISIDVISLTITILLAIMAGKLLGDIRLFMLSIKKCVCVGVEGEGERKREKRRGGGGGGRGESVKIAVEEI